MTIAQLYKHRITSNQHVNTVYLNRMCPKSLDTFAMKHPLILVAEMSPQEARKYNINTNERLYLYCQVSHNLKNYQQGSMVIDKNSQMSTNVLIFTETSVKSQMDYSTNIFLLDRGIYTQQEENGSAAFKAFCASNTEIDVEFFDDKLQRIIKGLKVNPSDITTYSTKAEKAQVMNNITGNIYDPTTGDLIGVPILPQQKAPQLTQLPVLSQSEAPPSGPNTPIE